MSFQLYREDGSMRVPSESDLTDKLLEVRRLVTKLPPEVRSGATVRYRIIASKAENASSGRRAYCYADLEELADDYG